MKSLYLLVDFFTVLIPILFSFHPKIKFYKQWKPFFISNLIVASLFILWDSYFTKIGVWGFSPAYISGIYFINLPVEEILFFVCIPYACVFTYFAMNLFYNLHWENKTERIIVLIFSGILMFSGIYFYSRLYTSWSFISLSVLLFVFKFFLKVNWLGKLMTIFILLLIPFFIVNGILTGTGLESPVVWYNNNHNLTIRILTIPVEDIFYGFELVLLNVGIYEFIKIKFSPAETSL